MSHSPESPTGYSTFEITLPDGINEQTLALFGLGNALGWNIKQRAALSSDLMRGDLPDFLTISDSDLADTSERLWDTPVYGENAANFIDEVRKDIRKIDYTYSSQPIDDGGRAQTIVVHSDMAYRYRNSNDKDQPGYDSELGRYSSHFRSWTPENEQEKEKVEELFRALWPLTPYPFEAPTVTPGEPRWKASDDERDIRWWDIEPGSLSRLRLAHYARVSGIAKHVVCGAIGKSLDVINVTAGLKREDEIREQTPDLNEAFIDYDEFRDILKNSGLTDYGRKQILNPLQWGLAEQVRHGEVSSWRAVVIVEGSVQWVNRGGNRVVHPEKIAKSSLAHLLDREPESRDIAPRAFLRQFA